MLWFALWLGLGTETPVDKIDPDVKPVVCDSCAEWNVPHKPFRIFGNSYYVGPDGLSSVLITSDKGHVLIDGALPQSAPQIAENIASLGFRLQDVKWIVSSHAHYDHAGGIAALSRKSGARVAASKRSSEGLRSGSVPADDPQVGYGAEMLFPKVKEVRELSDGEELTLGTLRIKVHYTPGHTPGATSYSWQSCEGTTCLHMVYADSLNAVSAPGFRFSAQPMRITEFEQSIEKVKSLPCDVVISAHPSFSRLFERQDLRRTRKPSDPDPMIDQAGCRSYALDAQDRLHKRLSQEQETEKSAAGKRSAEAPKK